MANEWLAFAISGPVLWAINNVVDRFLLSKHVRVSYSLNAYYSLINVAYVLALAPFISIAAPPQVIALSVGLGMVLLGAFVCYARGMQLEEASRVVPLAATVPVFVATVSVPLLGEVLTLEKYGGIGTLIAAGALVSYKRTGKLHAISPAAIYMLLFAAVVGSVLTAAAFISRGASPAAFLFWETIGLGLGSLIILSFRRARRELRRIISLGAGLNAIIWGSQILYFVGIFALFVALTLGPASLVTALQTATQPLFVLIYTVLFSLFVPRVLKEDISSSSIMIKSIAVALVAVGAYAILA